MAVQFSGSRSTSDRRRRRLVVNGDGTALESTLPDGSTAEMESELVASEAAGPWVPASEKRLWIYAAVIGVGLAILSFALLKPALFHKELAPLTNHLLKGDRPVLVVSLQTIFLALSAQMGLLISWYRSRCRLDFGGRYRVWPWVTGLLVFAAFCSATETHRAVSAIVSKSAWLTWRPTTVAWLLPFCVAALPITLWVDRDMRNSRSSLYTFRVSVILGVIWAWFEIYHPDLKSQTWFEVVYLQLPMFASATLFLSLWHHARVVAYVCPDPPELDEQSAWSLLLSIATSMGRWMISLWPSRKSADDKPKRRRKKTEAEATPAKRKRRTPARRSTAASRTRNKPAEVEDEDVDSTGEAAEDDTEYESSTGAESSDDSWDEDQEDWNQQSGDGANSSPSKGNARNLYVDKGHNSSAPAPRSRRSHLAWMDESSNKGSADESSADNSDDDSDDEGDLSSGPGGDPMRGLSKRQRREMKKQMRDQDRSRGR